MLVVFLYELPLSIVIGVFAFCVHLMNFSVVYNNWTTTSSLFFPFLLLCKWKCKYANSLSWRKHLYFLFSLMYNNLHALNHFFFLAVHFIVSFAACILNVTLYSLSGSIWKFMFPKRLFNKLCLPHLPTTLLFFFFFLFANK